MHKFSALFSSILLLLLCSLFSGCKESKPQQIVIWTDRPEMAAYVERFNVSQKKAQAILVYKENPGRMLPPAQDELPPDIIVASWLRTSSMARQFLPLEYIFNQDKLKKDVFYDALLEGGAYEGHQYLLPVSFNLPAVIYSTKNSSLVPAQRLLTLEQIEETAASFNKKNKSDIYTAMGFAPRWNTQFLYEYARLKGANFVQEDKNFSWNNTCLQQSIAGLKNWTTTCNTSTTAEQDFSFKYLYIPPYKQVASGRTLFACLSSENIFSLTQDQQKDISFAWLSGEDKIPVDENAVYLGMYRSIIKTDAAEAFILWFLKADTQKSLLERTALQHLDTNSFGIAGGFSSIIEVNEYSLTDRYPTLPGNLPKPEELLLGKPLPSYWSNLRERIIIPYLTEASDTDRTLPVQSMEERIAVWSKQYF